MNDNVHNYFQHAMHSMFAIYFLTAGVTDVYRFAVHSKNTADLAICVLFVNTTGETHFPSLTNERKDAFPGMYGICVFVRNLDGQLENQLNTKAWNERCLIIAFRTSVVTVCII